MAMTPCVAKFSVIMFGLIRRLLVQPWVYCITRVRHFLALPLRLSFTPALRPPLDLRPSSDKQHKQQKDDFIESIDKEAICRLASKQKGGLPCHVQSWSNGSFNVCFVVAFSDGCTRVVRVPLEPVVYDVWDKVCSEVSTMLYIQDRTTIPIPRVYAYGRCRLKHDDSSLQAFIIMDYIDGNPLDKAILHKAPTEARRRLLGEIVDVFAQLRGLEFSQGGSLTGIDDTTTSWSRLRRTFMPAREECFIPKATTNASFEPRIVGAFSIRKNELQIDGYTAPRFTATTAKEFFEEQCRIMRYMWSIPSQLLTQECAERQLFAVQALESESVQQSLRRDIKCDTTFCLSHPDLRAENIIVDSDLHLCGILDWEFSELVPCSVFIPPTWITGHDRLSVGKKTNLLSDFLGVVSSRQCQSPGHLQLAREWNFKDDLRLPVAHILRDPDQTEFLFYEFIYPKQYDYPCDDLINTFFQKPENCALRMFAQQRVLVSKQYTDYLNANNLFDEEPQEWRDLRDLIGASQKLLEKTSDADANFQELLAGINGVLY